MSIYANKGHFKISLHKYIPIAQVDVTSLASVHINSVINKHFLNS